MAQRPRGEPHWVPNPVGALFRDTLRQKSLMGPRAETAAAMALKVQAADYFSRPKDPFGFLPEARAQESARMANARHAPFISIQRFPSFRLLSWPSGEPLSIVRSSWRTILWQAPPTGSHR